jgi:acetyl esterase/lipase
MDSDHRATRRRDAGARSTSYGRDAAVIRRRRWLAGAALALAFAAVAGAGIVVMPDGGSANRRAIPAGPTPSASPPGSSADDSARQQPSRADEVSIEVLKVGRGVRAADVVRPAGATAPLPGVIFLHGWGLVRRADYRPWIRHLARAGNEVIVPRYQRDESSDPGRALADALGIRAALRRAPVAAGSLVVAGHSAGGALAADYAAVSAQRRLPVPVAVFSVYPGRRIPGYPAGIPQVDPAHIGPRTELVAMAGSADVVVGQAPAQQLVADATAVPARRKRYVLVQRPGVADHYGPTRATRSARRVFWARLDRLIRRARSG